MKTKTYERFSEKVENRKTLTKNRFSFYFAKTYLWVNLFKENSLKFQRFILRPKFKKVRNLHIMAISRLKSSKFHASSRNHQGHKDNPMTTKLGKNIISFLYFKMV